MYEIYKHSSFKGQGAFSLLLVVLLGGDGIGFDLGVFFLGFVDLDEIGHDLFVFSDGSLIIHHNFNLYT